MDAENTVVTDNPKPYKMECVCGKTWVGKWDQLVATRQRHNDWCKGWPMISDNSPQAR